MQLVKRELNYSELNIACHLCEELHQNDKVGVKAYLALAEHLGIIDSNTAREIASLKDARTRDGLWQKRSNERQRLEEEESQRGYAEQRGGAGS